MSSPRSPNPHWKPGDPVVSPVEQMVSLDAASMTAGSLYRLMIGAIVPRPIAFVSTVSPEGVINLAPFSFFNGISSAPPTLMFSVSRKRDGQKKDTLINIEKTGQFVVNTVSEWMVEPMHQTSAEYPYGISELEKVGLTSLGSTKIRPPRVKESAVQLECELYKTLDIGDPGPGASTIVVGKIVAVHVASHVYDADKGEIKLEELKPVARLGAAGYGLMGHVFEIPRITNFDGTTPNQ